MINEFNDKFALFIENFGAGQYIQVFKISTSALYQLLTYIYILSTYIPIQFIVLLMFLSPRYLLQKCLNIYPVWQIIVIYYNI